MFSLNSIRKQLPFLLSLFIISYFLYLQLVKSNHLTNSYSLANNNQTVEIGSNLSGVVDWSTQLPFIDGFKSSRKWITQAKKQWNTGEFAQLKLDENGWVKSLSGAKGSQKYTQVATLLYREMEGHYPGGKYVVLYEGKGTIEYGFDAKKDLVASTPNRDVIDVKPSNAGILLKITATDPDNTGNYIKNIRVIPSAYEKTYNTEIFNPKFLEKIRPFKTLRFMDWMGTNNSQQRQWSERPTPNSKSWSGGVPVEIMVALVNRLNVNPWFNMPHQATDDYVKKFATYVRDNLKPGLKIYVEYSNEVWNPQFQQYHWVEKQSSLNVYQTYGQRTTQIINIWDNVFGKQKERIIGIMGAQAANPWTAEQAMLHADDSIDALAIAFYVGGGLGRPNNAATIEAWTKDPDGGLNKLFDELNSGNYINKKGHLPQAWKTTPKWRELSQKYNLPLVAYEGGQHLVGVGAVTGNKAITNLFIQANRDPRMGEIYEKLITQWSEVLGGTLFMNFNDISQPSKWGSWGALEYLDQESSPKYEALINQINLLSSAQLKN